MCGILFGAPNCTILEPLYTRFDKTCESYDSIRLPQVFLLPDFKHFNNAKIEKHEN